MGNRLRRQRLGAKLRLFAVTTTMEHSAELHEAIVAELSRLRIQAEVVVVDSLAGTNITEHFRDYSAKVKPGLDFSDHNQTSFSMHESVNDIACSPNLQQKIGSSSCGILNPVATARKDGISTHHRTLEEAFTSEDYEEP